MQDEVIKHIAYQYLYEQSPIVFLVLNRAGKILDANAYTHELMGADICTKTIQDVFVDFAMSLNLSELVKDSEKVHLLNIKTFTGLPQTFYFNFFDLGEHILALGKLDVIELETLRKQLVSLNNELHNLTRELQKKSAELARLNQLKNQFLGMAAHDLRKPIAIILMYSGFLIDEAVSALSDEHGEFLQIIKSSSESMRRLIDDFLDIAVIESGKFDLYVQPTNLSALIRGSLSFHTVQARKKQVELVVEYDERIPELMIDGPKIEQVVNNLVSNAIEHSQPNTTVRFRISYHNDMVTASVQDEGPGIPQDELKRLFKPFERTSAKKTAGEKSTGLGLAIAQKIIMEHHGKMWVESEPGKGSIFYFTLPITHLTK